VTDLMSSMRDMKETMKSIYRMDYEKKGEFVLRNVEERNLKNFHCYLLLQY